VAQQLAGVERLLELGAVDRDGHRILAAAVQDAGHLVGATNRTGAARSGAFANFDVQDDVGHMPCL